jgi:hypothetical protein
MNELAVNAGINEVSRSLRDLLEAIPKNRSDSRFATKRLLQSVSSLKKLVQEDRQAEFLAKLYKPRISRRVVLNTNRL